MTAIQAYYPIQPMTRPRGVPRSRFYAHTGPEPFARDIVDAKLARRFRDIHLALRETYGATAFMLNRSMKAICQGQDSFIDPDDDGCCDAEC